MALRIAPCRRSSALTAVGAWEVRIVVELGVLRMYAISDKPEEKKEREKKWVIPFFGKCEREMTKIG